MTLRILFVDDHPLIAEALAAALAAKRDVSLVACRTAREACEAAPALDPRVIVLDVTLPGISGVDAIAGLRECAPAAKILMLSMHSRFELVTEALRRGAAGYALKSQSSDELVEAILTVAGGGTYLAASIPRTALEQRFARAEQHPLGQLTAREREIFGLVVKGWSNAGIAEELAISVKTVETHRAHINRKLGAHCPADCVRYAVEHGLMETFGADA